MKISTLRRTLALSGVLAVAGIFALSWSAMADDMTTFATGGFAAAR